MGGVPPVRYGLGDCYRAVMVDSIASSVTDLVRELIGMVAFVEGAAPPEPGVQAVPTPVADIVGSET